jgi:hypothetical protein
MSAVASQLGPGFGPGHLKSRAEGASALPKAGVKSKGRNDSNAWRAAKILSSPQRSAHHNKLSKINNINPKIIFLKAPSYSTQLSKRTKSPDQRGFCI